jgi:4-aminobutyrate--pyruvate transaminase
MFGSTTFGLKPDMVVVAKALSSAYMPISAVMVSEPIYRAMVLESEKIGTFGHGYTYSGHPVPSAVALETLKIYEERDIVGHVRRVAPRLQDGLRQRFADHPLVGEIRGVGLIAAVELVADKKSRQPFDPKLAVGAGCVKLAQDHGLILRALGDAVAFCPPLIITTDEIDLMLTRFGRALDETYAKLRDQGLAAVA